MHKKLNWTKKYCDILQEKYPIESREQLLAELPFNWRQIQRRAHTMGVKRPNALTRFQTTVEALPETCGVYSIKNTINNKEYVGSTSNIRTRIKTHIGRLHNNKHVNKSLQHDWTNRDTFIFNVLYQHDDISHVTLWEQQYIHNNYESLYNVVMKQNIVLQPKDIARFWSKETWEILTNVGGGKDK